MRYTWHIASDMQLFWLSPIFIYPLWRSKRLGLISAGVLISLTVILDAIVQSVYNLPPSLNYLRSDEYADDIVSIFLRNVFKTLKYVVKGHLHLSTNPTMRSFGILRHITKYRVTFRVYFLDGLFIDLARFRQLISLK